MAISEAMWRFEVPFSQLANAQILVRFCSWQTTGYGIEEGVFVWYVRERQGAPTADIDDIKASLVGSGARLLEVEESEAQRATTKLDWSDELQM